MGFYDVLLICGGVPAEHRQPWHFCTVTVYSVISCSAQGKITALPSQPRCVKTLQLVQAVETNLEIKLCQCHDLQSDDRAEICARHFLLIKFTRTNLSLHRWVGEFPVLLNHQCQRKPSPTTKESQTRPECLQLEPLIQTPADFSGVGLQPSVGSWTQSITADQKTRSGPGKAAAAAGSDRPPLCWGGGSCVLRECVAALIQLQPLSSPKINTHLNYGVHSITQIPSYRSELISVALLWYLQFSNKIAVFILCTKLKVPF